MQLNMSVRNCKAVGNIPWSHCVKTFSNLPSPFNVSSIKNAAPSMLISGEVTGKNMGVNPVLSHRSLLRNHWPKRTGVLEHCREGEANVVSPFFGAFPSGHIPKATKEINVQKFSSCTSSFKSHQRILGVLKMIYVNGSIYWEDFAIRLSLTFLKM
jgi:hypothetical protein